MKGKRKIIAGFQDTAIYANSQITIMIKLFIQDWFFLEF